jgi:hypothetical protein
MRNRQMEEGANTPFGMDVPFLLTLEEEALVSGGHGKFTEPPPPAPPAREGGPTVVPWAD